MTGRNAMAAYPSSPMPPGDGRPPARRSYSSRESDGDRGGLPLRGAAPRHIGSYIRGDQSDHATHPHRVPRRHRGDPGIAFAQQPRHTMPSRGNQPSPGTPAAASTPEPGGEAKAVTQAILEEIDKRSELMANIEYLCDMIGPRLTGSPGLAKANHWTRDKFQAYGLANARTSSPGRSNGRGPAARPRAGSSCRSSSASCWNPPAGAPRPRARCAGLWSTSRRSRPTS